MSFTEAIKTCFNKYVCFEGRARRSEYWYWTLFAMAVSTVIYALFRNSSLLTTVSSIVSLAFLLPGLGVCVRRLHDIGKSGWTYLFILIPFVGAILLLVWICRDSQPGSNQYGPNPKG